MSMRGLSSTSGVSWWSEARRRCAAKNDVVPNSATATAATPRRVMAGMRILVSPMRAGEVANAWSTSRYRELDLREISGQGSIDEDPYPEDLHAMYGVCSCLVCRAAAWCAAIRY